MRRRQAVPTCEADPAVRVSDRPHRPILPDGLRDGLPQMCDWAPVLQGGRNTEPNVDVRVTILVEARRGWPPEAQIDGRGPIPADVARTLAADGKWRRWITNTDGKVLATTATTATTYRPPESLARLVRARDPHRRMPRCPRPDEQCDIDHAAPRPQAGRRRRTPAGAHVAITG